MSWKSDDTNKGTNKSKSWPPVTIDCMDLRPGDWLHIGQHQQMFRRWLNGSGVGKQFVLYHAVPDGRRVGQVQRCCQNLSTKYYRCYRRPNIIDDNLEHEGHYCTTSASAM
eukprot:Hpha_TRINITY_DN10342_c1_g1::TRINITY_DN10342_c1_g1_i1::g.116180::m.116180